MGGLVGAPVVVDVFVGDAITGDVASVNGVAAVFCNGAVAGEGSVMFCNGSVAIVSRGAGRATSPRNDVVMFDIGVSREDAAAVFCAGAVDAVNGSCVFCNDATTG